MNDRIDVLLTQLTLDEKISLLAGADMWRTVAIERLGIPSLKTTDGPIGARGEELPGAPTSACFPCGTALAATWNPDLVERVGQALAGETKAKGAHILLAPTVNIHRSPLAGRNFECYSEDPFLTARMAVAYIKGLQSGGVGACIKHFVCNDSEFERTSISSEVGERALREIYLRPFEIALHEAKPWAVMSSYNRVNGIYSSENDYLLKDILKGEWGFDGLVMSDWYGTYSPRVVEGGLDLEMPGPARWMGAPAQQAARQGRVSTAALDDKVRRLLRTLYRVGACDSPPTLTEQAVNRPQDRELARQAATEAIVLLKNDGARLPLNPDQLKSIAVIGENAVRASIMGGGSTRVWPHYVVTPLDAIQARAGGAVVRYALGCPIHKRVPLLDPQWLARPLVLEYWNNREFTGLVVHMTTTRVTDLIWFTEQLPFADASNFSARVSGEFTVPESGMYVWSLYSVGGSRLYVDGQPLIDLWLKSARVNGGEVTAELELEAGRAHSLCVEFASEPGTFWRNLRIGCIRKIEGDPILDAVRLAAESDAAIIFAGLTSEWESEGFDRRDIELPGDQNQLIEQVAAANPNTIVVLNGGSPLAMPWLDRVPAVLQAWYLGQETGSTIADVLFGAVNPSGKLPTTLPKRLQDNPAFLNYPGENGKVLYGEGLFVGYRYYDTKDVAPLFPFGHGLSYTTFAYRNLRVEAGPPVRVTLEVENTGERAGQEVVQLYLRDCKSKLARPVQELKAFEKVALAPGEVKQVTFTLDMDALSYYDDAQHKWVVEPGEFEVRLGSSSRDIRLRARFEYTG